MYPPTATAASYAERATGHDELVAADGAIRPHWSTLVEQFEDLGPGELVRRRREISRLLEQDGVTYNVVGRGRPTRPWRLDPVPLVVADTEWRLLERATLQRAELMNLILSDLYGERRLLRSGSIPAEMILSDPQFVRPCDGITIPGSRQLVVAATDVARGPEGDWLAIGQRTQAPSGASYALENRRAMVRVFPRLFRDCRVELVSPYIAALRNALLAAAPPGVDDPRVVVLSPGALSETAFEHAAIAAQLGYPLVQGQDLQIRGGQLGLRTVRGWTPVHVVLRRVDAEFCDPLALRSDSTLGVPGLVDACRAGTVNVVNTLGSGVLENAGLGALLEDLCDELLDEDLLVRSTPTWWCGDAAGRSHVLANLGELVVRPLSRLTLEHSIDSARLSAGRLEELRRRIEAEPGKWVGQERVEPATAPALASGGLEPRRTVLRTFAIAADDSYVVMPGGLARTSPTTRDSPISNRTGAMAKDVWVLRPSAELADDTIAPFEPFGPTVEAADALSARAAEHLFWLGRYAERAEATVRLVRAVNNRRDEFQDIPAGPGPAALVVLLEALTRATGTFPGFVGDDATAMLRDPAGELVDLIVDDARPGTIAHAVRHMFDAMEVLRDQLSVDTWLVVGSLERELDRLRDQRALDDDELSSEAAEVELLGEMPAASAGEADELDEEPGDRDEVMASVLDAMLQGLLSFAGLANESMVRDHGWQFMEAGRRIERALQVTSLVGAALAADRAAPVERLVLESVLGAAESIITARRRYRSRARAGSTIELLFGDKGNPRSLRFQIDRLGESLSTLREYRADALSRAIECFAVLDQRLAEPDWVELTAVDEDGYRRSLSDLVFAVRSDLAAVADAVGEYSFDHLQPQMVQATLPSSTTGGAGGLGGRGGRGGRP